MAIEPITHREVQSLRAYRTAFRWAAPMEFALLVALVFNWPSGWPQWGLCVPFAVFGASLFALRLRGTSCPRCRQSMFLPGGVVDDENSCTDYLPIPEVCRACGVRLLNTPPDGGPKGMANARPGAEADGGGSSVSGNS